MIFTLKNSLFWIAEVIGFIPFFYLLFKNIYYYSEKVKVITSEKRNNGLKFFVLALLIIFGSYLVYFWRYFPAKMTPDSYSQIYQIQSGDFSDHHPVVHTKFVGLFYNLGTFLFHSNNWGIGLYTLVQMLIMASLYAYVCYYLYKQKVDLKICFLVLLAYAFLPQYTHYSVTLWKDILFSGSFILIFISLLEFSQNNFKIKQIILFTIGLIMMLFFRHNGIYIVILMAPFLLWRFRDKIKLFASLLSVLLISFFVIKGPVYQSLGISKVSTKLSLSIPLQQMARVVALDKNIDKDSQKYLAKLMDIKKLQKEYLPYISDPAVNASNQEVINADKMKFIKVWVNLFFQNPQVYVEAYLVQTLGYWFPSVDYLVTTYPKKFLICQIF